MDDEQATEAAPEAPPPLYQDDPAELAAAPMPGAEELVGAVEPEPAVEPEGGEALPADPRLARAWEDYTHRDQQLLQRQQQIAQREKELAHLAKVRDLAKTDPVAAMEAAGIDPRQALSGIWGKEMVPDAPEDPTAVLAPLEAKIAEQQQQIEQLRQHAEQSIYAGQLAQTRAEVAQAVAGSEGLELVNLLTTDQEMGGQAVIDEIIQIANYEEETLGRRPPWSEVLQRTEDVLIEKYCDRLGKVLGIEKIKQRLEGKSAPSKPKAAKPATQPPTLTADMNAEPAEEVKRPATTQERRDEALKALKGAWVDEKTLMQE